MPAYEHGFMRRGYDPRQSAVEPYYGNTVPSDYISRNLPLIGQVNPSVRERMKRSHGRYLSGFGSDDFVGPSGADPAYQDRGLQELENQDDVYGSGIFDTEGSAGTANADTGVFASHYSVPGYIGRETPFAVSNEVTDITDNADVVYVPGGGMSFVEFRGQLRRPPILGPTPRQPYPRVSPAQGRMSVYKQLYGMGQNPAPLNANAPNLPMPQYKPPRNPMHWSREVPFANQQRRLPMSSVQNRLPRRMIVQPKDPSIAIRGMGQNDKEPASKTTLAVAGIMLGISTGIMLNVLSKD